MKRIAKTENSVVVNVVAMQDDYALGPGEFDVTEERVGPGFRRSAGVWIDPSPRTSGLSYDQFRALFTVAELTLLDSHDTDAYLQAVGKTPLTVTQKAQVRYLISEAKATGDGPRGINLGSPKMGAAVDALIAMGLIDAGRKAEIIAGTVKS